MKTITLTDEQYQALCNGEPVTIQPPKPKWKPKKYSYFIDDYGHIRHYQREKLEGHDKPSRNFGMSYPTQQASVKARDAMRTHNRLLAWLSENDDGWVADWGNFNQSKYYVYFCHRTTRWLPAYDKSMHLQSVVYMSQLNVHKLCKLLNDGVVEL